MTAGDPHILRSTPDKGQTWYAKSGANANVADTGGGDSIPYNSGPVSENGVYIAQWSRVISPTKYYFFNGQRLAMKDEDGVKYLLGDHLHSTSLVLNANGNKVAESRYYPYGETRWTDGTLPTDYRFTGQRRESSLGLYHMGARFYDPYLARWLSADTIVPEMGDPQAFNRYSYCIGNPLKYIDPSGHSWDDFINFVGQIPGYEVTAENLDLALTIVQHPEASAGDKALAVGYLLVEGVAHGAVVVGGVILAWEGVVAVTGAVAGGEAIATVSTATTAACADGDCTNEATATSKAVESGLSAIRNGVGQEFSSFRSFKYHMGGAGEGNAWHHIVGQLQSNVERFGAQVINNTNNLIRLPDRAGEIHRQVTGFMNSIQPQITGSDSMRVYEWLSTKSFEFQWKFGIDTIIQFGGEQYIIEKFGG